MCCLKNEQEAYEDLNRSLPHIGAEVTTSDGWHGVVQSVSVLRQLVKVIIENESGEREVREYHVSELNFQSKKHSNAPIAPVLPDESLDESELQELENLEKEDLDETADIAFEEAKKPQNKKRQRNNRSKYQDSSYPSDRNNRRDNRERKSQGDRDYKRDRKERNDSRSYKNSFDNKSSRNNEYTPGRDSRRRNRNSRNSRKNNYTNGNNGENA